MWSDATSKAWTLASGAKRLMSHTLRCIDVVRCNLLFTGINEILVAMEMH